LREEVLTYLPFFVEIVLTIANFWLLGAVAIISGAIQLKQYLARNSSDVLKLIYTSD